MYTIHQELANLLRLAKADGDLNKDEILFIYQVAHKHGVSKADLNQVITQSDFEDTAEVEEALSAEAIASFYRALLMASVDVELSAEEEVLLSDIGQKLGLAERKVKEAIAYARENSQTDLNQDQLKEVIS